MKYRQKQENTREKQKKNFLMKLGLTGVVIGVGRPRNNEHYCVAVLQCQLKRQTEETEDEIDTYIMTWIEIRGNSEELKNTIKCAV